MERERIIQVIKDQLALCGTNPETDRYWVTFTADDARLILELLKNKKGSIPISWLKEKLTDHPELSYALTDGIQEVLTAWEHRND